MNRRAYRTRIYRRLHTPATSRARLRATQAMTLIEIMVVLVIIGMIAGGVAVAVIPRLGEARIESARNDALRIAAAVEGYMLDNSDCPSVEDLVEDKQIKKAVKDPWGNGFKIECDGDNVTVTSAGKDEQFGSEDDVSTNDDPHAGDEDN